MDELMDMCMISCKSMKEAADLAVDKINYEIRNLNLIAILVVKQLTCVAHLNHTKSDAH